MLEPKYGKEPVPLGVSGPGASRVQAGSTWSVQRIDDFRNPSPSDFLRRMCPDEAGLPGILPEWSADVTNTLQPRETPCPANVPFGPSISTSFSLCQPAAATIHCCFACGICMNRIRLLTAIFSSCTKILALMKPEAARRTGKHASFN